MQGEDTEQTARPEVSAHTRWRPGDVLRYRPERHHAREGTAFVRDDGRAYDTFWSADGSDMYSHALTAQELDTAEAKFNVDAFDELDRYAPGARSKWETYNPDDRARVTMQHGLQEVLFVRRGAAPDMPTQIANAESRVAEAVAEVDAADRRLRWARDELRLLRDAAPAAVPNDDPNGGQA